MINSSLRNTTAGFTEACAGDATAQKTGLDTSNMANFRPVSNLSFVSKVVEKFISRQLNEHLTDQRLLSRHQSAYRKYRSTETAMLRVMSVVLTTRDADWSAGFVVDSSAFDCVDHSLLLQRLESTFSLSGTVLCWLTSYITNNSGFLRSAVNHTGSTVRSCAWICFRPFALRSVYG